jgi:hypothetical protein
VSLAASGWLKTLLCQRARFAGLARGCLAIAVRNALEVGGVLLLFEEIGDVKEGVALETYVDECRLHSGEDSGDASLVDGAGEGVFVLALVINFCDLIVFDDGQPRFMRRTGDVNLF